MNTKLKVVLSAVALAALVAAPAIAKSRTQQGNTQTSESNIYESYSKGQQSYPNPDRDYLGETRYPAPPRQ